MDELEPLYVDIKTAARLLSMGETHFRDYIRKKQIRATYFGPQSPRISMEELRRFAGELEAGQR